MGVLTESWCFCKGVGKSERIKAAIFSGKGSAVAGISVAGNGVSCNGFLIHRNLLLTTHLNIPSVAAAESCEIRLQNGVSATLFPHRFFITSSILDLTIVGVDSMNSDSYSHQPHCLKTRSRPNLDHGSVVYVLGYTEKGELMVSEGKVIIATDNLIKLSTDGVTWSPGSAGFDAQGNLAFMVCDPMKLATSPNTKSCSTSSSSSSSWKKDLQFGMPLPIICDWLNQHWEGSLDELNKPKLPLIRLRSTGQKNVHSSTSFTVRQVFKPVQAIDGGTPSSNAVNKSRDLPGASCSTPVNTVEEQNATIDVIANCVQGIPTPEIYESPKITAFPVRKKETAVIQLLDINFPPRVTKTAVVEIPIRPLPLHSDDSSLNEVPQKNMLKKKHIYGREIVRDTEASSSNSVNEVRSKVQSCSSPMEISEMHNGHYSSEEETMYSAETAESRNYTSPRDGRFQQVGRSQSCVSYDRWGTVQTNPLARRNMLEKQRSFIHGRKIYSEVVTSQRSNDYFSPTVSSIMKKRNEQPNIPQRSSVRSSSRWVFQLTIEAFDKGFTTK